MAKIQLFLQKKYIGGQKRIKRRGKLEKSLIILTFSNIFYTFVLSKSVLFNNAE